MNHPQAKEWMWSYCEYLGEYGRKDLGILIEENFFTGEHCCISDATVFGPEQGDYCSGELYNADGTFVQYRKTHWKELICRAIAWRLI